MGDKEQPNYYAIIPATVRYDNNLKSAEKLLYGEVCDTKVSHSCQNRRIYRRFISYYLLGVI